ncbi:MAG: hypothetical protein IPM35_39315 [Myxococcales bacterium]|nr:hypothetical protein [Myxococcales bacterium]
MRGSRLVLFSLPLITVVVIAFALFVVGAPRPYVGARVYGGPTEGASRLSLRLALVERFVEIEGPAKTGEVSIEAAFADGRRASARATPDDMGVAGVTLDAGAPIRGPVILTVTGRDGLLAHGSVSLSAAEWAARAVERGGFLSGQKSGALVIRVAPARGAIAVPFPEALVIEVRGPAGAERGAEVVVEADGADVTRAPRPTDASGRTSVTLAPRTHLVSLTVKASNAAGATGDFTGFVPVTAGALRATVQDGQLRVESPIERDVAYYSLISETERLSGGALALSPDQRGGSVGLVALPPLPSGRLWAVVSSEPELDTASTVGWPLVPQSPLDAEPPRARAVPDRMHLDGLRLGFAKDAERRQKARYLALGFTLLAGLLAAALLVREGRRSARELDAHLREAGADAGERTELAPSRWLGVVVAILCVGMGFSVVLLVAMYRI